MSCERTRGRKQNQVFVDLRLQAWPPAPALNIVKSDAPDAPGSVHAEESLPADIQSLIADSKPAPISCPSLTDHSLCGRKAFLIRRNSRELTVDLRPAASAGTAAPGQRRGDTHAAPGNPGRGATRTFADKDAPVFWACPLLRPPRALRRIRPVSATTLSPPISTAELNRPRRPVEYSTGVLGATVVEGFGG